MVGFFGAEHVLFIIFVFLLCGFSLFMIELYDLFELSFIDLVKRVFIMVLFYMNIALQYRKRTMDYCRICFVLSLCYASILHVMMMSFGSCSANN